MNSRSTWVCQALLPTPQGKIMRIKQHVTEDIRILNKTWVWYSRLAHEDDIKWCESHQKPDETDFAQLNGNRESQSFFHYSSTYSCLPAKHEIHRKSDISFRRKEDLYMRRLAYRNNILVPWEEYQATLENDIYQSLTEDLECIGSCILRTQEKLSVEKWRTLSGLKLTRKMYMPGVVRTCNQGASTGYP